MSYARYGERGSDVYVWSDGEKYFLSVASNRRPANAHCQRPWDCPERPFVRLEHIPGQPMAEWRERWDAFVEENWDEVKAWEAAHYDFTFHPLAGKEYTLDSLAALYGQLAFLKKDGIKIPKHCFDRVMDELTYENLHC